jgi:predicted RNA polymerase sigma factor
MIDALGLFQLEAAIESVHIHRKQSGTTDLASLALLYEGLLRLAPSVGAAAARAVAVGHAQGYVLDRAIKLTKEAKLAEYLVKRQIALVSNSLT